MKSKFKINDEVFFMKFSKPHAAKVQGISFVIGSFKAVHFEQNGTETDPGITYFLGAYDTVPESELFATSEELKNSLFKELDNK